MKSDEFILVLGGAGLVGAQIVREIARKLEPDKIIVASLFRGEVREFLHEIRREFQHIEFIGAWGDVFVRTEFTQERRRRLTGLTGSRRSVRYRQSSLFTPTPMCWRSKRRLTPRSSRNR